MENLLQRGPRVFIQQSLKLALALISLTLFGCGKVPSENISEKSIYQASSLKSVGNGRVECYSRITVDNEWGSTVELSGQDHMECNGYQMKRENSLVGDYIYYKVEIPLSSGGIYEITLVKNSKRYIGQVDAVEKIQNVSLQNGFQINPLQTTSLSWQKSTDPEARMWVNLSSATYTNSKGEQARCSSSVESNPESGTMIFGALKGNCPDFPSQDIVVTYSFTRSRLGSLSGIKGHIVFEESYSVRGIAHTPVTR